MLRPMELGLRERKKERTRRLIADTAWRLFADRGFEQVTVAEVAREAEVAVATVFNYFPTKEDLFFFRLDAFGAYLVDAVATRAAGEPVLVAFRRHLLGSGGLLAQVEAGDRQALERLRTVSRVIAASPALQVREQQAFTRTADALAARLAAETGAPADDLRPRPRRTPSSASSAPLSTTPADGSWPTRSPACSPPTSAGSARTRSPCSRRASATTPTEPGRRLIPG